MKSSLKNGPMSHRPIGAESELFCERQTPRSSSTRQPTSSNFKIHKSQSSSPDLCYLALATTAAGNWLYFANNLKCWRRIHEGHCDLRVSCHLFRVWGMDSFIHSCFIHIWCMPRLILFRLGKYHYSCHLYFDTGTDLIFKFEQLSTEGWALSY